MTSQALKGWQKQSRYFALSGLALVGALYSQGVALGWIISAFQAGIFPDAM